jgi:hypothetical protein
LGRGAIAPPSVSRQRKTAADATGACNRSHFACRGQYEPIEGGRRPATALSALAEMWSAASYINGCLLGRLRSRDDRTNHRLDEVGALCRGG